MGGFYAREPVLKAGDVERLLGQSIDQARSEALEAARTAKRIEHEQNLEKHRQREAERQMREKWADQLKKEPASMTVSLYRSTSTGAFEMVVQTNAQSLDVYIAGLAEAVATALKESEPGDHAKMLMATLKNAIPVAFAIAGYKAEKVAESKLLTCGQAAPDASELVAQSRV
jgi:hypothetical protein